LFTSFLTEPVWEQPADLLMMQLRHTFQSKMIVEVFRAVNDSSSMPTARDRISLICWISSGRVLRNASHVTSFQHHARVLMTSGLWKSSNGLWSTIDYGCAFSSSRMLKFKIWKYLQQLQLASNQYSEKVNGL
jgi:hypothetical protein